MSLKISKSVLAVGVSALSILTYSQTVLAAALPGGGNEARTICKFDASPQGFRIEIYELIHGLNGNSLGNHLEFTAVQSRYFTATNLPIFNSSCPGPDDPSQVRFGRCLIGEQNTGFLIGGLFQAGKGFARDSRNSGAPIDGNVYEILGHPISPAWTGQTGATITTPTSLDDCTAFTVIASQLNNSTDRVAQGLPMVPVVTGASMTYNDHSFIRGNNAPVLSTIFNDPDYDPFSWVDQQEKEWHAFGLIMGETTGDYGHYIRGYYPDFDGSSNDPYATLGAMNNQEHLNAKDHFTSLGLEEYFTTMSWNHTYQTMDFQKLEASATPMQVNLVDEDADLFLVPRGWGSPEYPRPQQSSGNASVTVTSIYPSNLFDPPKHPNYYAGNNQNFYGPTAPKFSHAPLPAACNPSSDEYIQAASFQASVFEELRLDWKYLTQKNWDDLNAKGFDFLQDYTGEYTTSCNAEDNGLDGGDCLEHIVVHSSNPGAILRPLRPGETNLVSAVQVEKKAGTKKGKVTAKFKPKRKNEAYYSDLIHNKMIVINPDWTQAHRNSCKPKPLGGAADVAPEVVSTSGVTPKRPVLKKKK